MNEIEPQPRDPTDQTAPHPTDQTDPPTYTIGTAAEILGVTVRTLRHWDEIGLLTPQWRTWGGHRLYLDADLHRAHRVLVYREAGMPLRQVKELIDGGESEKLALIKQREILKERAAHLHSMLTTIDELIKAITMNSPLSPREAAAKFGFEWRQDWQDEAEERWAGTDAWAQAQQRQSQFSESDWQETVDAQHELVEKLHAAVRADSDPNSEEGREISALHRRGIAKHFDCDHNRQVILARMYTRDDRFRAFYDNAGDSGAFTPGATDWLLAAIEADARANGVDPDAANWG